MAFTEVQNNFRLGEQSEVYITTGMKKGTPALPSAAVVSKDKKLGVWVVTDGRLAFKPVTVGLMDRNNFTEIASGLGDGERVALTTAPEMLKFKEGMKVRIAK